MKLLPHIRNDKLNSDAEEMASTPRVVVTGEGRVVLGNDDTAYVRGDLQGRNDFQLLGAGKPLKDPGSRNPCSRKILSYEAAFLCTMLLQRCQP